MKIRKNGLFNMLLKEKNLYHQASDERGFVLVVSLILLLVITIMGILALSTSTTEVMVAGNQRMAEVNEASAEGGRELVEPVLKYIIDHDAKIRDFTIIKNRFPIIADPNLHNEVVLNDSDENGEENLVSLNHDCPADAIKNPDLFIEVPKDKPTSTVTVDIDYLFAAHSAGSAIEFASGTEGMGKGMSGGSLIYYKANTFSQNPAGTLKEIGSLFRYVVKQIM